jgi:hypothetical protein
MKKRLLTIIAITFLSVTMYGQAASQLSFGFLGAAYEIPLATDISIAPFVASNLDLSSITAGAKGNYYFDNLIGIPDTFDFYAGVNAGFSFPFLDSNKNSNFDIGAHVGGRWFWSEQWGLYVELGGGMSGAMGGLGLTLKL